MDRKKARTRALEERKMNPGKTDYVLVTDLNIGHDNTWEDVKKMMEKLHFHHQSKETLPAIFKIERIEVQKMSHWKITLPDKDEIIYGNTKQYLVLIPADKENVIMPKYYDYLSNELDATDQTGKYNP